MIQRIQTVYLLLSALLTCLAIFFPLVGFSTYDDFARLSAFSLETAASDTSEWELVTNLWSLGILFSVTSLLNFVVIFLYKKRRLQIKLTHYSFVMKIAIVAVLVYFSYVIRSQMYTYSPDYVGIKPYLGSLSVIVAMVFDWLAVKAIRKDEALVRSCDRIR